MKTGTRGLSPLPGREIPMSAARDSPGPLTTHPMTATFSVWDPGYRDRHSGSFWFKWSSMSCASSRNRVDVVRPHPGHAVTDGRKERRSKD